MSGGLDSSGNALAMSEMFSYPTIRTDQSDYPPGSPVIIYGSGWFRGDPGMDDLQETESGDPFLTDTADATCSFTDTSFYVQDSDGGVKFLMTATGERPGQTSFPRLRASN